jgi:hypothetical protein
MYVSAVSAHKVTVVHSMFPLSSVLAVVIHVCLVHTAALYQHFIISVKCLDGSPEGLHRASIAAHYLNMPGAHHHDSDAASQFGRYKKGTSPFFRANDRLHPIHPPSSLRQLLLNKLAKSWASRQMGFSTCANDERIKLLT